MASRILRLEKARIHKKYDPLNKAEVKFYTFAADQNLSLPELEILLGTKDPAEVRENIKAAAKAILNRWERVTVRNVPKNHIFTFGDTGRIVYDAPAIPDRLDWLMLVLEVDRDIRNLGERVDEILPKIEADSLAEKMTGFVTKNASAPHLDIAVALGKLLLQSITFFMKKNKNDQTGIVEQSFFRDLDFPGGTRHGKEVQNLTGNMWYTYTLFAR